MIIVAVKQICGSLSEAWGTLGGKGPWRPSVDPGHLPQASHISFISIIHALLPILWVPSALVLASTPHPKHQVPFDLLIIPMSPRRPFPLQVPLGLFHQQGSHRTWASSPSPLTYPTLAFCISLEVSTMLCNLDGYVV